MKTTWVVVAESARAKIYSLNANPRHLQQIHAFAQPRARVHEQRLTTDLPGCSFDGKNKGQHAITTNTSPKQQAAIAFSKEISGHLEQNYNSDSFNALVLVAEPHFLGLLRKSLTGRLKNTLIQEINKNLVRHPAAEVAAQLTSVRKFSDS